MRKHRSNRTKSSSIETKGHTIHWARWYDPLVHLMSFGRTKKLRQVTIDLADLEEGQTVLDMGCGTGQLTSFAQKQVGPTGKVTGVDAAAEMIAEAQKKYPRVDYRLAAVEDLPFEDDTFDVVISSLVLHHLPTEIKPAAMQEVLRVLKPGGRVLHVDFAESVHGMGNSREALEAVLRSAGYANVTSGKTPFRPLSYIRAERSLDLT